MSQTAQVNSANFDAASLLAYERPQAPPSVDPTVVPPPNQQTPGMLPPPGTPPAGVDQAEYKEFLAFKEAKAKAAAVPAPSATPTPASEPVKITPSESNESVNLMDNAAGSDPVMKSMLTVFDHGAKGLDRSRALGNALARGDASLVDVAYIREHGGEQAESLIEVAKSIVTHATAAVAEVSTAILAASGGQAGWDAAAAAFNKTALPSMRDYVAKEMESGNRARILAAAAFVTDHAKGSGLVTNQGVVVQPGGGNNGNPSESALSKGDFKAELAKLDKRDRQYQAKTDALFERRVRGANAGL